MQLKNNLDTLPILCNFVIGFTITTRHFEMLADKISDILSLTGQSIKSIVKLVLQSRRPSITKEERHCRLIILGNGPSLATNIANDMDTLCASDTLAVNFAGNTAEFSRLRPRYYLLMDPHFFAKPSSDPNVSLLFKHFNEDVDWDITLFIPTDRNPSTLGLNNRHIRIERFNPVGVEGFEILQNWAFDKALGLPRPRNVLIPAIMTGIWLGYKKIYILGADHGWLHTLYVNNDNAVVSVQPHFYEDSKEEHHRVTTMFRDIKLHELLWAFHLAFKGYHTILRYATLRGIEIYNSTPGSFIDAFPRHSINK